MDGKQPSLKVHEWNLAVEKQISRSTVVRQTYKGKHGQNTDQLYNINAQPNDYIWYLTTARNLPTGEFSGVLRRSYDQNAYTDVRLLQRSGYLNSSVWSIEAERRYSSRRAGAQIHGRTRGRRTRRWACVTPFQGIVAWNWGMG